MSNSPPTPPGVNVTDSRRAVADQAVRAASAPAVVQLLEEVLEVDKQQVLAGTVRVSTRTETYEDVAEIALEHSVVDVTRVPVDRLVKVAPEVRTEGNTTIVPVLEERFVVVKQIYLKEEIHIVHRVESEVSRTPVQLRRQSGVVERIGPDGRPTIVDDPPTT